MPQAIGHHHLEAPDDPVLPVYKRGRDLLTDPMLNKGTGFPDSERDALGIRGLVPPQVVSIDDQASRAMENFRRQEHDLDRYIFLESLHDRNETLYYRVLLSNIRELTPIIYTPTVGKACSHFGHIYRRARGMYFGAAEIPYFEEMVRNQPEEEIDIVVVTDGSRILGLGDLGANGMGIPIGKLSLYVLVAGMMLEGGLSLEQARSRIWMLDSKGLLTLDRLETLGEHKREFARDEEPLTDLVDVIRRARSTVLIGVSGIAGAFSREVLGEMCRHCDRPILLPLSNPTTKAECTAEQAYEWTDGKAIFASGSPFPPLTRAGRLFVPGQCNNMYIFPGVGMAAVSCRATRVSDRMFYVAARTLAEQVGEDSLGVGRLYPDLAHIREISTRIAVAVSEVAFEEGLAGIERPEDLDGYIRGRMFHPHYVPYARA